MQITFSNSQLSVAVPTRSSIVEVFAMRSSTTILFLGAPVLHPFLPHMTRLSTFLVTNSNDVVLTIL